METDLLSAFVEEAHNTLAGVRACILTGIRETGVPPDLAGPIGMVRSLRSTAQMFPVDAVHHGLTSLENGLSTAPALNSGGSAGLELLDRIVALETELGRFRMRSADPHFDVSAFVDHSFE